MGEPCKVFVGNLSYDCNDDNLLEEFSHFGKVEDAVVISDRDSGRSRGFGFVTFSSALEADAARKEMDGQPFLGRNISVKGAENKRGGGGGGRRGGYGGGGGGYGGGGGGYGGGGGGGYGGGGGGYGQRSQEGRDYRGNDRYQSSGGGGGYNRGGDY